MPLLIRELLSERGISSEEAIFDFFTADIHSLANPFAIRGVDVFISRLREAVEQNERILIYGDKDADGISASAIAFNTLKKVTKNIDYFVPTLETGYGLAPAVLDEQAAKGVTLIITVDCGISNKAEIARMRELGIDVIVTDHHDIPAELPDAFAVFNPKLPDSGFSGPMLSGCGVIFKLMQAFVFSYTPYYNKDFIILDVTYDENDPSAPREIKALRLRNLVPAPDGICAFMRTPERTYRVTSAAYDEPLSIAEMLEELSSFMFESEDCRVVITGGKDRFNRLISVYQKHDITPPPIADVYDLIDLGKKYASARQEDLRTFTDFILSVGVNPYHYADDPFQDILLRGEAFARLFLMSQSGVTAYAKKHLPVVAIGTVADVMPLTGENRTLVKAGLAAMGAHPKIRALLKHLGVPVDDVTAANISWKLAPFINAAGRMGKPDHSFKLLTEEEESLFAEHTQKVQELNEKRKSLTEANVEIVKELIRTEVDVNDRVIVIKSDRIEQGLTGLIAGRIVTEYQKPSVVVFENRLTGECVGSTRSRNTDNVRAMVESARDVLLRYGGHTNASGFTLRTSDYASFRESCRRAALELNFGATRTENAGELIMLSDIDDDLALWIERMQPFGQGNEEPVFIARSVTVDSIRTISKAERTHLAIAVSQGPCTASAMLWRASEDDRRKIVPGAAITMTFTIRVNRYNGAAAAQLNLSGYEIA